MNTAQTETVLDLARRLTAAGVCVIPISTQKPKAPAISSWLEYEKRRPTDNELRSWFGGKRRGLAAIGGLVSGGLECLDFDEPGLFERWADDVSIALPGILARLVIVQTPKKGAHVWYRCAIVEPNQVLAWRSATEAERKAKPKSLREKRIETRGEGGYALLPGCPPECHELGGVYTYSPHGLGDLALVQTIAEEERETLIGLARSLNTYAEPPKPSAKQKQQAEAGLTPGDDYDRRGGWQEILEPHGWQLERGTWEEGRLTRPGKSKGVSATLGVCHGSAGESLLYVFSTGSGMEVGTYGRFRALAALDYNGDLSATAKALAARGYGEARKQQPAGQGGPAGGGPATPWTNKPAHEPPDPAGISAADLMRLTIPPARFAVPGLLCEGLTILGGRPKQGKSWLALLIAWAVAGGRDLDGRPCPGGDVLYLGLEDTRRRFQDRLRMLSPALAGWDFPPTLRLHTAWQRADQGGLYCLAEWLSEHKGTARLIVVDTLAKFRTGRKGNGNTYDEDYESLGQIKQLADNYGASALVVHHTRKMPAEDPFDELSGTLAISGAADGIILLDRKRGDTHGRLFVTGRDVPESTIPLSLDRETWRWTLGTAEEGIDTTGRHVDQASNKVEHCAAWLLEFLREFAHPSTEIVEAAKQESFSFGTLKQSKAKVGRNGSGQVVNHNYGYGPNNNDWWSGLGPVETWTKRPEEIQTGQTGRPDRHFSGHNGRPTSGAHADDTIPD